MIVTIDGEAGAGKTTVAALVAGKLGCPILESGSLYRALACKALREGADTSSEQEIIALADRTSIDIRYQKVGNSVLVDERDVTAELGDQDVGEAASAIAGFRGVRHWLLPMQRRAAERGDLVAEGRDMGSVVFPDAEFKFFLKASLDVRAERKRDQLEMRKKEVPFEKVRERLRERDERDAGREWAPMKAAPDAVVIDTSETDAESVVDMILKYVDDAGRRSQQAC